MRPLRIPCPGVQGCSQCLIESVDLCRPSLRLSRTQGEFDWEFENIDSLPELQDLVLKEILEFQADPRNTQPIQYSSRCVPQ